MMQIKKIVIGLVVLSSSLWLSTAPVFAHAVVKPSQAGIGSFTDFSLGVPSEKDVATTSVKLMIPEGLNFVSPIVKPGWKIEVKSAPDPSKLDDDGNPAKVVSEIGWTGGSIPAGQKDFFMFSAQVPAKETELVWRVIQTYADGSTVTWNLGPNDPQPKDSVGKSDFSKSGPYSKTIVVNDLKSAQPSGQAMVVSAASSSQSNLPLVLSGLAVLLSVIALGLQFRQPKM